jgi:hypothetical protein
MEIPISVIISLVIGGAVGWKVREMINIKNDKKTKRNKEDIF